MNRIAHTIILLLLSCIIGGMCMTARDLPTTEIGGQQCYIYQVKKSESIYDVARSLNITTADITRYNPTAADGLRMGMHLYIPTALLDHGSTSSPTQPVAQPVSETVSNPISLPASPITTPSSIDDNQNPIPSLQYAANDATRATTYTVGRGESLYGISRKVNMTLEEIIALNPEAEYGVKQGDMLVLSAVKAPVSDQSTVSDSPAPLLPAPIDYSLAAGERQLSSSVEIEGPSTYNDNAATSDTVNMAVILPFMLHNGSENDKNAKLFIEFYKGLLLAVDSLQSFQGHPINLYAFDSEGSTETVTNIMADPRLKEMSVIIGPDNDEHLRLIARDMAPHTRLFNTFNVRSALYKENPHVIQANIPHSPMLSKAVEAFTSMYAQYTPVFLQRIDGDADKDAFTSMLKQHLDSDSIAYHEITFKNMLSPSDLNELPEDANYVFVPVSGKRAEFAKISEAIRHLGNARPMNSIRLFGYPDWIIFRGEYFSRLCELEATIYTRFYADMRQPATMAVENEYKHKYGTDMLDAAPVQGLLGFDTGMYLISLLKDYGNDFASKLEPYTGLQSVFNFETPSGIEGSVNNALLIVTFTPGGSTIKTTLE